jgi:hypothetical protein
MRSNVKKSIQRTVTALIAALCFASVAPAQNASMSYEFHADSASVTKALRYNLGNYVQSEIEAIAKSMNNSTYLEFHIGANSISDFKTRTNLTPLLGVKCSLFRSKLVMPNDIKAKIFKVRQLAVLLDDTLSAANNQVLTSTANSLLQYDKDKWRRFSIMISFPFNIMRLDSQETFSWIDSSYYFRTRMVLDPTFLQFVAISVCYDLGDFGTVSIGVSLPDKPRFMVGLSLDVSTPTYAAITSFINHFKAFTYPRLPMGNNYY